jgi:hypothetical protein
MARDDKLIYKKPVAISLDSLEKTSGVTPHCKSGTIPGPGGGEGDCGNGTVAHSEQQFGCYSGGTATTENPSGDACSTGTNPSYGTG